MMTAVFILIFSTTLCGQKKKEYADCIVFINGDSLYGRVSSVKDGKLIWSDGDEQMEFFLNLVYRVYQISKDNVFAPSYIEKGLEKVKNTKPQVFRINKEKSGGIEIC